MIDDIVQEKTALTIFKVDSTSGTTMTAQQEEKEEKEDDMSVQVSYYTAKILCIAEESKQNKSAYQPLSHVCPSSAMVERLFCDAKHIMTEGRRHMEPSTLEMWLILKKNKDLCNSESIDNIIFFVFCEKSII